MLIVFLTLRELNKIIPKDAKIEKKDIKGVKWPKKDIIIRSDRRYKKAAREKKKKEVQRRLKSQNISSQSTRR